MVVAARLGCDWGCDDRDVDPEHPCSDDPDWQRERNCDGAGVEKHLFGGVEFNRCPVAWLRRNPEERALFSLYVDCCGGVIMDGGGQVAPMRFLPFASCAGEERSQVMDAFTVIRRSVEKLIEGLRNNRE